MSVAIKEKKRKNMMNRFLNLRLQRKFKLNMTIQMQTTLEIVIEFSKIQKKVSLIIKK